MPACVNCGPGTTPAVITVGDGLDLSGVGTPSAPYRLELEGRNSQLALEVRDTSSVNLTLIGSGSLQDPYVMSADTGGTSTLTALADYSSPTLPNDGEVVTWVGSPTTGHWQPKSSSLASASNAASLTSGVLSNDRLVGVLLDKLAGGTFQGNMNSLLVPGMYKTAVGTSNGPAGAYPYGTLVVYAAGGTGVTQQYMAHANNGSTDGSVAGTPGGLWVRTKYNASDWTAWGQYVSDPSALQSAGTLDPNTDWNTLTTRSGIYRIQASVTASNNAPLNAYGYGTLVVVTSGTSVTQVYYAHGTPTQARDSFQRTKFGTTDWAPWSRYVRDTELSAAQAQINALQSSVAALQSSGGGISSTDGTSQIAYPGSMRATNLAGANNNALVRQGRVVTWVYQLNVGQNGGNSSNARFMAQLPDGFKPLVITDHFAQRNGDYATINMAVDTDGHLNIRASGINPNGDLYGSVTFVAA